MYNSKLTSYKFTDLPTRADFVAAESEWSIPCPLPSVMPLYQPASTPPWPWISTDGLASPCTSKICEINGTVPISCHLHQICTWTCIYISIPFLFWNYNEGTSLLLSTPCSQGYLRRPSQFLPLIGYIIKLFLPNGSFPCMCALVTLIFQKTSQDPTTHLLCSNATYFCHLSKWYHHLHKSENWERFITPSASLLFTSLPKTALKCVYCFHLCWHHTSSHQHDLFYSGFLCSVCINKCPSQIIYHIPASRNVLEI